MENKLSQAAGIYAEKWLSEYPDDEYLSTHCSFSANFENKMNRLIKQQKKPYYVLFNTVAKRAAAIILVIVISLSAALSVEAIRTPIINFFSEVYEKFTNIWFDDTASGAPEIIEEIYLPDYIPEGFELVNKEVYEQDLYYTYSNGDKQLKIWQTVVYGSNITLDTENTEVEKLTISGFEGIYYENKGLGQIFWSDEKYAFHIVGNLEKHELIMIAESLKRQNLG